MDYRNGENYVKYAETAGKEPDELLLAPIREKLRLPQSKTSTAD